MQKIVILGSTGSIGTQSLDVIRGGGGRWQVVGLAARSNAELLMSQIREFRPRVAAMAKTGALTPYRDELRRMKIEVWEGPESIRQVAALEEADKVIAAISGMSGLLPTYEALKNGKTVALANKESLVTAGGLIMPMIRKTGARILPVDSEHSAIFQCIDGKRETPFRLWLTASGGPFFGYTRDQLKNITPREALKHPTWEMGAQITIDSATLLNKGLEVIEAHWLFQLPYERIETVIHPQSIVHSIVEYEDGSFLAQLSKPDMRLAIQYALCDMEHRAPCYEQHRLLPHHWGSLQFHAPDLSVFEGLELAIHAGRAGGTMPAVLNAAKEVAVDAFLKGHITFLDITRIISQVLEQYTPVEAKDLEDVLAADRWARLCTAQTVKGASGS